MKTLLELQNEATRGTLPLDKVQEIREAIGVLATVTAVQPPGRWGALDVHGDLVTHFREKPNGDGAWTNGGFFLLEPEVAAYIEGDEEAGKYGYGATEEEAVADFIENYGEEYEEVEHARRERERDAAHNGGLSPLGNALVERYLL